MKIYKVTGTNRQGRSLLNFIKAASQAQAETHLGIRGGGDSEYVSWSTETVEELPAEAVLTCPHCSASLDNPVLVTTVVDS